MGIKEILAKVFRSTEHERYRIRLEMNEKNLLVERFADYGRNSFPYWANVQAPDEVIKKVLDIAKKSEHKFSSDGLSIIFNEEMLVAYKEALRDYEETVVSKNKKTFDTVLSQY